MNFMERTLTCSKNGSISNSRNTGVRGCVISMGLFKGVIGEEYINTLGWSTKSYPHAAYVGLEISLQLEWNYLQKAVLGVIYFMGLVDQGLG